MTIRRLERGSKHDIHANTFTPGGQKRAKNESEREKVADRKRTIRWGIGERGKQSLGTLTITPYRKRRKRKRKTFSSRSALMHLSSLLFFRKLCSKNQMLTTKTLYSQISTRPFESKKKKDPQLTSLPHTPPNPPLTSLAQRLLLDKPRAKRRANHESNLERKRRARAAGIALAHDTPDLGLQRADVRQALPDPFGNLHGRRVRV